MDRHINNSDEMGMVHKCSFCSFTTNNMREFSEHCQQIHDNRCSTEIGGGRAENSDFSIEEQNISSKNSQLLLTLKFRQFHFAIR